MSTARSYIAKGQHPFRALTAQQRLGLSTVLAIVALVVHRRQSVHAKTPAAPHGTMSFALTDHPKKAKRIRSSWPRSTRQAVDGNLRLDILFSLAWTNAIALADLWAAEQMAARQWPIARIGDAMAWTQWGSAIFAVTKDVEKLVALQGRARQWLERVGRWATMMEIATKGAGITYAGAAGVARLYDWYRTRGIPERDDASYMRDRVDPTFSPDPARW